MAEVAWNALMNAPNAGIAFSEAYQRARHQRMLEDRDAAERAWQREQQAHQRAEWQREGEVRGAKSAVLLGGPVAPNALMTGPRLFADQPTPMRSEATNSLPTTSTANPTSPLADDTPSPLPVQGAARPPASRYTPDQERLIRSDPDAFLTFQGKQLQVTADQLKGALTLNDAAMQLLGSVYDQASYDAGRARARELYQSFGFPSDGIDRLPPQYSPELVRSLQLQGMDTSKQLAAIARENKLAWDIEDDLEDNARADRNTDSMISHRREGRGGNRSAPARGDASPKSEGAIYADIMDRWRKGGEVNGREKEFVRGYEARRAKGRGGGNRGAGRGSGRGAPVQVSTPAEARKLAPGTIFVLPDGRVKVR